MYKSVFQSSNRKHRATSSVRFNSLKTLTREVAEEVLRREEGLVGGGGGEEEGEGSPQARTCLYGVKRAVNRSGNRCG